MQQRLADLDAIRLKHPLHHIPITSQHPRMMNPKPIIKQLLHLLVPRHADLSPEKVELRMSAGIEIDRVAFHLGHLFELFGGLDGVFAGVDEDHDLVAGVDVFGHLCPWFSFLSN